MTGKMFRMCAVGVAVGGLSALISLDARGAVTYRKVAISGESAPGTGQGIVFSNAGFNNPVINSAGQTAFWGIIAGTDVDSSNSTGIWSEGNGTLSLVVQKGAPAPGTGDAILFNSLALNDSVVFNSNGQTAFLSSLTGPGVDFKNAFGIWLEHNGSLRIVIREGETAPGTGSGVTFKDPTNTGLNGAGQIVFLSFLTGPGVNSTNDRSIWLESGDSLHLIAREGDPAPGTDPGVVYNSIAFFNPVLNQAGHTAFRSSLAGQGIDNTNDLGIWSGGTGLLKLVARTSDHAPGTEADVVFKSFGEPVINGAGQTAFIGFLTDPRIANTNVTGIWTESSGSLALVARTNDAAPGVDSGSIFSGFANPVLNDDGKIAFKGFLKGIDVNSTNNRGIWSDGLGSLALKARIGDAAPGTDLGVVFGTSNSFPFALSDPVLNGKNQIAFVGGLTGQGVDGSNDVGIWATNLKGELILIARKGDLFDVNDDPQTDDFRIISAIGLATNSGSGDGRRNSFNDAGQLAFNLTFIGGGEGIFVATIPEPASLVVFVVGAGLILGKR